MNQGLLFKDLDTLSFARLGKTEYFQQPVSGGISMTNLWIGLLKSLSQIKTGAFGLSLSWALMFGTASGFAQQQQQPQSQAQPPPNQTQYRSNHPLHPLFEREFPNEDQLIQEIIDGILQVQQMNKAANGHLYRGTHAKGVCARATFEVQNVEDDDLRSGLFATPARYSAIVRFANAASGVHDDRKPDVRSMSIAVDLGKVVENPPFATRRQDFSFNNSPTFPINDIGAFAALFRSKDPRSYLKGDWTNLASLDFWKNMSGDLWSTIYTGIKGEQQKTRPAGLGYQKMRFWSGVPFLAGEDAAIKYVVTPCSKNPAKKLMSSPDQLSIEFKRHINEDQDMSCFEMGMQKLDADVMTNGLKWYLFPDYMGPKDWVENASIPWPTEQAPVQPVARLTFEPKSILPDEVCEQIQFSVGINSLPAHRGLGSLNRARTFAEWESGWARNIGDGSKIVK